MRLSDREFYALTPRQLNALIERKEAKEISGEFLLAQLTAHLVNFSQRAPKTPAKPEDFMPSEWRKRKRVDDEQARAEQLRAFFRNWNARQKKGK